MKYKLVGLFLILLTSTPLFAQEVSPVIVATIKNTTPTVVKTGELFTQSYRIQFLDLSDDEIIIDESTLNTGMLDRFEIVKFEINKSTQRRNFLVHIWDLKYTLRIIEREKGHYKISPMTILWKRKKIGQKADEAKVNTNIRTEEVHVDYVTTITQDPESMAREQIEIDNFRARTWILRGIASLLVLGPLGIWLFALSGKLNSIGKKRSEDFSVSESEDKYLIGAISLVSKSKARRNLKRSIKNLASSSRKEKEILVALEDFIRSEIPQLGIGATPLVMQEYLSKNLSENKYKKAMLCLALRAVEYKAFIEGKKSDVDNLPPEIEAKKLRTALNQTRWRHRLLGDMSFKKRQS